MRAGPLYSACRTGDVEAVRTLLKTRSYPSQRLNRAVQHALQCGHSDIFQIFREECGFIQLQNTTKKPKDVYDTLLYVTLTTPRDMLDHFSNDQIAGACLYASQLKQSMPRGPMASAFLFCMHFHRPELEGQMEKNLRWSKQICDENSKESEM